MRVADLIVELLIENEVEVVFGVPGDTSMSFHNSFDRYKNQIKYLACRDERHAAYMADTYARVSGKVGVCDVPSGGGLLYAVPGLSEATSSSIPIICFSSDISTESEGTGALTELKQEEVSAAITKWNVTLKKASKTTHTIKKAFRIAKSGRPGAVHISIPENIHEELIDVSQKNVSKSNYSKFVSGPTIEGIENVYALLKASKKPIILAGGGVHLSQAYHSLAELVNEYRIPVVTTINGKGAIEETNPHAVGVIGVNGGTNQTNAVVREADFVLVLGSKLNNVTTVAKTLFNNSAKIVQVDISEEILELNISPDVSFMTDINEFIKSLTSLLKKKEFSLELSEWETFYHSKVAEKAKAIEQELMEETLLVNPARIIEVLNNATDDNMLFVIDAGTQNPYMAANFKVKKAGRQTVFDRGHGNLGYALSASMGAYYGNKSASKVFSMFGDGSFAMSVGELETAKRDKMPIVFMLFQNNSYGWIKKLHQLYYNEDYIAVDFTEIDGAKIAEGFGIKSKKVTHNSDIEEAIAWAFKEEGPVFLDFIIEPITDIVPPVTNWREDSKKSPEDRQALTY